MKKIIAITTALLLAGGVLLAPPANAGITDDRRFYALVTASAPTLKVISRREMVKTAKLTCKVIRGGYDILDTVDLMEENGFTSKEAIAFVAGSIAFYCPEQEDNL